MGYILALPRCPCDRSHSPFLSRAGRAGALVALVALAAMPASRQLVMWPDVRYTTGPVSWPSSLAVRGRPIGYLARASSLCVGIGVLAAIYALYRASFRRGRS